MEAQINWLRDAIRAAEYALFNLLTGADQAHSSILAWRIPWTEEPGGLRSMDQGNPGILEWVAYPFSSGSSQPRNGTRVSCIAGRFFTN